jgi:hypothetical protein
MMGYVHNGQLLKLYYSKHPLQNMHTVLIHYALAVLLSLYLFLSIFTLTYPKESIPMLFEYLLHHSLVIRVPFLLLDPYFGVAFPSVLFPALGFSTLILNRLQSG